MNIKKQKTKNSKKAIFYTMDALLASMLLIGAILLIYGVYSPEDTEIEQQTFISQDVLTIISELKINEINNSFVYEEILNGNITDINNSVLDQIGEYWALGQPLKAQRLLGEIVNSSIPNNYGLNTTMGNKTLFLQEINSKINSVAANRMISGIEEGKPILGSSGTSYLKKINDKKTSTYAYFGGFVGQGNITKMVYLTNLTVTKMVLELDVATLGTFQLKINGQYCNSSVGVSMFIPSNSNSSSDYWDITSCNSSLIIGENAFVFYFTDLGNAYISGGYIKIDYETDAFLDSTYDDYKLEKISGIDGAVNLYDSFYVPGELTNLSIYLHYKINTSTVQNTFFMTVGNKTVLLDNVSNGEVTVNLTDANLSMLNYLDFNQTTMPFRIGFENITLQSVIISTGEGFGDIIVTTDVSGSMNWEFDSSDLGVNIVDCSNPNLYDLTTRRLSVARCVNKIFVNDVLANTTLNRVGLVSYSDFTRRIFNLTNNQDALNTEINTYTAGGNTCIACGLVSAYNVLSTAPAPQLHNDIWKYDQLHQTIPQDNAWHKYDFEDSSWPQGNAPFGYKVAGINTVLSSNNLSVDLWEYHSASLYNDIEGPPNDFTSGRLNNTGNTYGLNITGNDGWDNATGVYGGNNTGVTIAGISSGMLRINIAGIGSRQISAGSYGIQFNVTGEMKSIVDSGGYVVVSFYYSWDDNSGSPFETDDQVWIKARLTDKNNLQTYLGTNVDSSHQGSDSSNDVWAEDNPDTDFDGVFTEDISSIIVSNGVGEYYLDLGGKLSRNGNSVNNVESGIFRFDNVQIIFVDKIHDTYYRNSFNMYNLTRFSDASLYVSSDNNAEVYLNNNLIDNETLNHTRSYWNRNGISVDMSNFVEGENVLAVKLRNNDNVSGFLDIELRANMTERQSAIVIMSDGDANVCINDWSGAAASNCSACNGGPCCPNSATGELNVRCPNIPGLWTALNQLVNISCYIHNTYDVSMYSVAFGTQITPAGTLALNLSAACDNSSHFYTTNNVSAIADIYQDIASSIVSGFSSRESQAIVFSGGTFAESTLYPDSYIAYNYNSSVMPPVTGEIEVSFESQKFSNCTEIINIPEGVRVIDAKITSYSGPHWTDYLSIDGIEVYNLSHYGSEYVALGDPFIIQIPPSYLNESKDYIITLRTADDPNSDTNCSLNNSFIYTAYIPSTIERSGVLPEVIGCKWNVESEGGGIAEIFVPPTYTGSKICNYTNISQTYNVNSNFTDAYDYAAYRIFKQLDIDDDGRIIVSLAQEDLEVVVLTVGGLPYMWGPSLIRLEVWQ
ncbi:MAG: hypothetical protein ACP5N1_00280 [Candidatus Woesearchaeota archaeon]